MTRVAEQTVKNHLSIAMRKLALPDRTQAVVMAIKEGWIRFPGDDAMERSDLAVGHGLERTKR
jgi:hypothetical protein